jgi:uncharacterized membrane protein YkvA (DUF1232 family)
LTGRSPALVERLRVSAHAVWLAARDPRVPWTARALALLIAAYALSPIDLVPDFIPVIGLFDDAILIPVGLWLVTRLVPPELMAEHRASAEAAAQRPVSWAGISLVLLAWAMLILIVWLILRWTYS